MVGGFVLLVLVFRCPKGVALALSSALGALVAGQGFPIRHLVEGAFGYLDPILIIATAMIFMKVIEESGALGTISRQIVEAFHRRPVLLLWMVTLFVMFPGMFTGLTTASVLTSGALIAPSLTLLGLPKDRAGALIAMAAIYGMVAPPIDLPAMIICGGVDMPYIGFELPLLLATLPLAAVVPLWIAYRHLPPADIAAIRPNLPESYWRRYGLRLYSPIMVVVALMLGTRLAPGVFPNLGVPLIFMIGSFVGLFSGKRIPLRRTITESIRDALPVMGILVGIGMFIQIMTLTGVRGWLVVGTLGLPRILMYLGIAVSVPVFGAVSAFGSASVLGVPFLLALLGHNEIITASGLSLMASLGDLMPPVALAGFFAAQVVGEPNYFRVLRRCLVPAVFTAIWAILLIAFATPIANIIL
jgi:TRAP-type C4-dicarboxylate transport system permease large subunit